MSRIIELKWDCADCGTKDIPGRHKRCPSCMSPREKGEMKMKGLEGGASAATVTDPELLKLAQDRPDWFCTHCHTGNAGSATRCKSCGSPRYAEASEDHPDFQGEHRTAPVERPEGPPEDPLEGPPEDPPIIKRTPPPPPPVIPPDQDDDVRYEPPEVDVQAYIFKAAALLFVILFGAFLYWAFQTHEVTGSVQAMSWSREVRVEAWKDKTIRAWEHKTQQRDEVVPKNGSGERAGMVLVPGSCREEHYEDERYVCGNHEECEDVYRTETESYPCTKSETYSCGETCRDNGNGFATCSPDTCTRSVPSTCTRSISVFDHKSCETVNDYCSRPIYKTECSYQTQSWVPAGSYPTAGFGTNFVWGKEPQGDEVRHLYLGAYKVVVSYEDGDGPEQYDVVDYWTQGTKEKVEADAKVYLSWQVGQKVTLVINNLGGVHEVKR